jgi:hypothetical protein
MAACWNGHVRAVDLVVLPVVEHRADPRHGNADEESLVEHLLEALVDRRDELARNRAADDLVDELVLDLGGGLEVARDAAVLAVTAGLLLVRVVVVDALGDRFAVGDSRGDASTLTPYSRRMRSGRRRGGARPSRR